MHAGLISVYRLTVTFGYRGMHYYHCADLQALLILYSAAVYRFSFIFSYSDVHYYRYHCHCDDLQADLLCILLLTGSPLFSAAGYRLLLFLVIVRYYHCHCANFAG
jgi:hypothetical protein